VGKQRNQYSFSDNVNVINSQKRTVMAGLTKMGAPLPLSLTGGGVILFGIGILMAAAVEANKPQPNRELVYAS